MGKPGSTGEGEIVSLQLYQTPTGKFCWRFLLIQLPEKPVIMH
jgi:hypothetical protein